MAISEAIERMAADRYKVVSSHESMFHRWAVVAGTGTQQLYLGREVECQNMARKFAGAFLDGAFVAMQQAAPQQEAQEPCGWDGAEEWEKLAWHLCAEENGEDACNELIWDGGPIPEPWGDRWLSYEGEARRMIDLVRTHVPAPQPAPAPLSDDVLRDAARLDWLALAGPTSICVVIDRPHDSEVEVATDDVTGYGKTLREALDAAIAAQGGK